MTGYGVDPDALESAIKKLEEIRKNIEALMKQAGEVTPGELTANDAYTNKARKAIQDRATGEHGSLRVATRELSAKLTEKIDAYKATLEEYRRNDDAAAAGVSRLRDEA
ncbi:hypothetical protein GCM10011581_09900 [Saccharopolyspora subtropica]|uniref:PE family protein n=1 Tax=Saccharopolyspora thermophila TaxID=89367 RepID=A0A917JP09_9PSEU|nr:hypothetical protein [Saccharopolyspora subtropica]GGI74924.1 hypothetical protein GCM10011581_09900 [Saccharopolyspora subtropica]